jgi:hypothetical protein
LWALCAPRERGQLLTEREVLKGDRPVSAADKSDRSEKYEQPYQHASCRRAFEKKINRQTGDQVLAKDTCAQRRGFGEKTGMWGAEIRSA